MRGDNPYFPIKARFNGRKLVLSRILPSSHVRKTIDHRSKTRFDAKRILIPSFIDFTPKITNSEP
jgi:hypothetical protein